MKKLIAFLLAGMLFIGIQLARGQTLKTPDVDTFRKELIAQLKADALNQPVAMHYDQNWQRASQGKEKTLVETLPPVYAAYLPGDFYTPVAIPASALKPPSTRVTERGGYGNPINVNLSSFGSFGHDYLHTTITSIYTQSARGSLEPRGR